MECNAYMASIIGTVMSINDEQIDVLVTENINEVNKNELILVQFDDELTLKTRVEELGLVQGSVVRVLYTEINEINGEKVINIIVPENIMLWQ